MIAVWNGQQAAVKKQTDRYHQMRQKDYLTAYERNYLAGFRQVTAIGMVGKQN